MTERGQGERLDQENQRLGAAASVAFGAMAAFQFVGLTITGVLIFDRGIGFEAMVAGAYVVTFSLLTGAATVYRRRRDGD